MKHLGMCFRGSIGSARIKGGLNDIKGLFQPSEIYGLKIFLLNETFAYH